MSDEQQRPGIPAADPATDLPEQMRFRRDKRAAILAAGKQPYPVSVPITASIHDVRARWDGTLEPGAETETVVSVGGRVVFIRNTGKLCFATLQGSFTAERAAERLQVMLSLAEIGQESLDEWKAVVDLGDIVSVTGRVVCSKRGELSIMATAWQVASKALRPLPTLHNELSEETRVRQRYVDLLVRPEAQDMLRTRALVTRSVRETLHRQGYVEVETPVLQLIHGGAAARPFGTHLNAFDIPMTMRIALELYLKRCMVGGLDRVYEIGRIFRNEGIDSSHSAEFTMLEAYQSWGDQFTIAKMTQELIVDAADAIGRRQFVTPAGEIDLDGEWRWLSLYPAVSEALGEEVTPGTPVAELQRHATRREIEFDPKWDAQKMAKELFEELVEHTLIQPTFVTDFPASAQPLARRHRDDDRLVEAWDLIIGGVERGTGFSELIDPVIQRDVLTAQSLAAAAGDEEAMQLDEEFLTALEFAAPPMGGMGLGMDRLLMLFTGLGIRETILFPLLKPQA